MQTQIAESKVSLLRTDQVEEMEGEVGALQEKLKNPNFQGDRGEVSEQLRRVHYQLETQRPRAYESHEIDAAVKREMELRADWLNGMLSQEEMRKCPPGAVDRHRAWEKRNKPKIAEWQNIQRRMNAGSEDRESASIERFRPVASTMNMDGAQIPGKQIYLPPNMAGLPVVFSAEQIAIIRLCNPQLADMLGTLTNVQRAEVKDALTVPTAAQIRSRKGVEKREAMKRERNAKPKRTMSDEHKAAMKAGREAARARKAA